MRQVHALRKEINLLNLRCSRKCPERRTKDEVVDFGNNSSFSGIF